MRSLRERRRPATLASEYEFIQRLSRPGRKVALFEGIRQSGRVSGIADGKGRPRFGMLGNLVEFTRPVRKDADHLVDREMA